MPVEHGTKSHYHYSMHASNRVYVLRHWLGCSSRRLQHTSQTGTHSWCADAAMLRSCCAAPNRLSVSSCLPPSRRTRSWWPSWPHCSSSCQPPVLLPVLPAAAARRQQQQRGRWLRQTSERRSWLHRWGRRKHASNPAHVPLSWTNSPTPSYLLQQEDAMSRVCTVIDLMYARTLMLQPMPQP